MRAAMLVLVAALALPSAGRADGNGQEVTGRTQAAATTEVRARVTGFVTCIAVKEGDAVAKGDLLVEVDPRPYQLALDAARAQVKVAEAKFEAARITATNSKKLLDNKVTGPGDLALNKAKEAEAEGALTAARVEAQRAELTLSWTRVTAPFAGRVSRIQAASGALVSAEKSTILTVVATDPLHVCFQVPEEILLKWRRDGLADPEKLRLAVGFAGENGYPHEAKLEFIETEVDSQTKCVRLRASMANPKGLLSPGMSARVRLTPAKK